MYLEKINVMLDTYAPPKGVDKFKLRFKSKTWVSKKQYRLKISYLLSSLIRKTL